MKLSRYRRKLRSSHRGSSSAVALVMALLRIGLPLLVIAGIAYWLLNHDSQGSAQLRVSTSVRGAEILIGGVQTGYVSDTTLDVKAGRNIVTVRKPGYVSHPEFAVVELANRGHDMVHFIMRPAEAAVARDSIPPLRAVRQEIFSTGEPVQQIPPVSRSSARHFPSVTPRYSTLSESSNEQPVFLQPDPEIMAPAPAPGISASTDQVGLISTQVTVSSVPEGAEIFVNGSRTENVTPHTFRGLDRGVYMFRAQKDGYITSPENATVTLTEDFQRELVAFELTSDPSLPRPTLTASTSPLAAGIRIDGRQAGIGKISMETEYGSHSVEFADVPGYKTPPARQITLSVAEPQAEVTGQYERLVGNAYIAIVPNDDVEKFDGSLLRIYVDNELILDNPRQRFDATLLGKILSGKRQIRVQYGDLSSETTVSLLDGEVCEIIFRIESFFSKRKLRLRDKSSVPLEQWQQRAQNLNVFKAT